MKKSQQFTDLLPTLLVTLMLSLPLGSCCEKTDLKLDRFDGFIDGVGDLHAGFDLDWLSGNYSISLDFWTGISAFRSFDISAILNLNLDFGLNATFQAGMVYWDVDNDAFKELVRVLLVTNQETGEQFRFFQWDGDKYTQDIAQKYVGFLRGDSTVIVVADAAGSEGVVIVEMNATANAEMEILACTDSYDCGTCDGDDKLTDCISYAEAGQFTPVVSANGSTDSATESGDTGADTESASGTEAETDEPGGSDSATDSAAVMDTDSDSIKDTTQTSDSDTASQSDTDTVDDTASAMDTGTVLDTAADTATNGNTDTSSSFSLDLDSDSDSDIGITIDSDTFTIDWGF
ncbi:MAG: hypothetical protein JXX14_05945 [Deltaproteobacteria bacterium]|nr:hypothetical protein [Deltaproteobacteria bacterium]